MVKKSKMRKVKKSGLRTSSAVRGGKRSEPPPAAATLGAAAPVGAEPAPSPHVGVRFISGRLGADLVDANDKVKDLLKVNGHKAASARVLTEPFTRDPHHRRFLASFVIKEEHREIIMPDKRFVSSFGASSPKTMDEETKAYLREKANAQKFLRPKSKPTLADDLSAAAKGAPKKDAVSKGPGIGAWVCDQLVAGVKDDKILKEVQAKFPGAKTNAAHLAWYRGKLKREGGLPK